VVVDYATSRFIDQQQHTSDPGNPLDQLTFGV